MMLLASKYFALNIVILFYELSGYTPLFYWAEVFGTENNLLF